MTSTTSLVQQLCELIEHITGMTLSGATPQRLVSFAQRRAEHLGLIQPLDYVRWVQQPEAHQELEMLINLVTNGLTAFWREPEQLDAVRLAMSDLYQTYHSPINVWSVGCSTGEEPYTLAMIAHEANIRHHILGTDINTDALTIAQNGNYGDWSLRRLDDARRKRYFEYTPEHRWQITPQLQQHIRVHHHNLLHDPCPAPHPRGWDIILCRNVFIYLKTHSILAALSNFAEVLNPNGYLMLGASEQHLGDQLGWRSPFRQAKHGAGYVFRLQSTPPGKTIHAVPTLQRPPEPLEYTQLEEETVDFDTHNQVTQLLTHAVSHIEHQRMEAAMACCEAALGHDPFVPSTTYLLGLLWRTLGEYQRAIDAFKQTLFLNPMHWLAAFELAKLYEQTNATGRARIAYEQTIEGLEHTEDSLLDAPLDQLLHTDPQSVKDTCLAETRVALQVLNQL